MNEEIKSRLVSVLDHLTEVAKSAESQIGPLAEEIVLRRLIHTGLYFSLSFIATLVLVYAAYKILSVVMATEAETPKQKEDRNIVFGFLMFCVSIPIIFSAAITVSHAINFLSAFFAPKLYVLEYVADLATKIIK
jgi:hypothetical protein